MSLKVSETVTAMSDALNTTTPSALEALLYSASGSVLSKLVFYLYPILSIWIVIANCLTLFVYAKFKRLQKKRNVMLISLSAVDLFTGLTQMMPKLIARLLGVDNSFSVCMVASALQIAPAWASVFHLGSIAIERYVAITKPLLYHVIVTPIRLAIAVGTNVSVAIAFAVIPLAWPREQFPKLCLSIMWYPNVYTSSGSRRKRNVMLISLSAVDLFTGLTQMMPKLIARLLGVDNSFTICMAASALQIAPAWASVFHLVSIAIERHIAITKPLMYHVIVTPTRLALVVSSNVILAALFAFIPLAWPREQFPKLCMSVLWYPKCTRAFSLSFHSLRS
ncbi:hypothetical protein LSH36_774g00009 [Paralvinella palmiformis]|uniref:G-protein coupled receptors family 1 profile domain-containing protein n=1 Tax=Paralvinella palmiformis TaxID=53620 RepID=A0AAD9MSL1_9ANNE|nr:hypothetical protein LSH36_774g00009 [Paralvinella palmiformis]